MKISEKSRRIGLSWADSLEAVLTAAAPLSEGGMDSYYIGFNKEMSETYINDAANWARGLDLLAQEQVDSCILKDADKDILVFRIRFASGHKVMALSSKPTNLRSRKGRLCLDEFAFHDQPEQLLKAARAFLMWGGKIAIISTHNGIASKFYEICEGARDKTNDWSLHRTTLDDALAEGLYKRICAVQNREWSAQAEVEWRNEIFREYGAQAEEELLCIPAESSNCLFNMDKVKDCAIGEWAAPDRLRDYLLCVDPNFGSVDNDFYTLQIWDITDIPVSLVYEYHDNSHGSEYHHLQTLGAIDAYDPIMVVFERNGGGLAMAERVQGERSDVRVETVNTGKLSKIQNTDRIALMVEQEEMVFPDDWIGIGEMRRFSRVEREALSGHDDCVMCCAVGMAMIVEARELVSDTRWVYKV